MKHFVKTMAPGWFAAVMGSAVASLAFFLLSQSPVTLPGARFLSNFWHWFAIVSMSLLGFAAIWRLVSYPQAVWETISHPVEGSFYATFPIALLVMAAEWSIREMGSNTIAPIWWIGTLGTILVSYIVLARLFTSENLKLGMVTPANFIPAVGLVVIPVAGAGLAHDASGLMREVYFSINIFSFGAGVFMYLGLLALTMARHFLGSAIEGKMTPTLWVHLAPLGVIPLSLLAQLHAIGEPTLMQYGTFVASLFLGAGLWWLVLAVILTVRNIMTGKLPFALSWWAFVFPIGAITVLTLRLAHLLSLRLLPVVGAGLSILLASVWLAAFFGTLRGFITGRLLPKKD